MADLLKSRGPHVITLDPILAGNILDNIYPIYLDIVLPDFGRSESSNELQCDPE